MPTPPASNGRQKKRTSTAVPVPARADILDLDELQAVLAAAGASWKDVVKTTVFLHDMADFPVVNEVYAKTLGDARPARSTVQVSALPRGVQVEIDAIVAIP